ncbi:hypothetical protein [Pedobacter psychrodurus]|uniref:hypothetical protein n=1 Tax=Pedobacter psychrodurus TaxID=2530456 RepID=UPI00293187DD|nr:hypothetical protein [Pedobacter psychrodurus]
MKYTLLFLLSFLSISAFCQRNGSYYVTHGGDTVDCDIGSYTNLRGRTELSAFSRSITVEGDGGTKKLKPRDIRAFVFLDVDTGYKFVTLAGDKSRFFHEVVKGKLSFYKLYVPGNTLPVMVKGDKLVYLNVIGAKKHIAELIADCPELVKEWEAGEKYTVRDREEIVRAYNACGG